MCGIILDDGGLLQGDPRAPGSSSGLPEAPDGFLVREELEDEDEDGLEDEDEDNYEVEDDYEDEDDHEKELEEEDEDEFEDADELSDAVVIPVSGSESEWVEVSPGPKPKSEGIVASPQAVGSP